MKKPTPHRAANGSGSVKWHPSMDRVVGQLRVNGKQIKFYGPKGDQSPAAHLLVQTKIKKYAAVPATVDATTTVEAALELYCDRKKLAPATRDRYKRIPAHLGALLQKRLIDVTPPEIIAAIDGIVGVRGKPMGRTKQVAYKMLRDLFDRAKDDGLITLNPVRNSNVEAPTYRREEKTRVYTPVEQRFILEAEVARGGANLAFLRFMLSMPVRPCEAFALCRSDVNLKGRRAHIGHDLIATKETSYKPVRGPVKTPDSDRDVFLNEEVAHAFSDLLLAQMAAGRTTPESFIFTSPQGGPVDHSRFASRWWKPLLKAAKVEAEKAARAAGDDEYRFPIAGLYSLRHTAIENLRAAGVERSVIQTLAGHSKAQTMDEHYRQPTDARKLDAAEAVGQWLKEAR